MRSPLCTITVADCCHCRRGPSACFTWAGSRFACRKTWRREGPRQRHGPPGEAGHKFSETNGVCHSPQHLNTSSPSEVLLWLSLHGLITSASRQSCVRKGESEGSGKLIRKVRKAQKLVLQNDAKRLRWAQLTAGLTSSSPRVTATTASTAPPSLPPSPPAHLTWKALFPASSGHGPLLRDRTDRT